MPQSDVDQSVVGVRKGEEDFLPERTLLQFSMTDRDKSCECHQRLVIYLIAVGMQPSPTSD